MLPWLNFVLYTKYMMKKTLLKYIGITSLAIIVGILGFTQIQAQPAFNDVNNRHKVKIVTTIAHIEDLVKNIAGGHAYVESLMGSGTDPHLYRPLRSDIVKLSNADIIFYNGRHLEGQMVELFETLSKRKPVYGIAYSIHNLIEDSTGAYDPHIWMDVENWLEASDMVTSKLSEHMPEHKNDFEEANLAYKEKLKKLDKYIEASIKSIPEQNRILLTAHDAFGYLGNAYGIEVIGIQGLSTASEAGLNQIEALVTRISEERIPAIFAESSVSDQNIRAIKEGVIANGHDVIMGGILYSDSLGSPNTYAGTYIGMMEHNVKTITRALGGHDIEPDKFIKSTLLLEND